MDQKKDFSISARIKSTTHAWRGILIFLRTCHNAWVHIFFGLLAVYLGLILHISNIEWVLIIFVIGLVLITEVINTAFEIDINLTSPEFHPYARDTKDVAAGAVLVSVFVSIIVALFIFLPKIFLI
jgi:diacylglycerol kinase